jgi:hypothetical protein
LPAMECLKMSTIRGGHYQSRISTIRAVTTDAYAFVAMMAFQMLVLAH